MHYNYINSLQKINAFNSQNKLCDAIGVNNFNNATRDEIDRYGNVPINNCNPTTAATTATTIAEESN